MFRFSKTTASPSRWLLQLVIISGVAALAVPFINSALDHWPNWSASLTGYLIGIDYAIFIGAILSPLSPWIWERTGPLPFVLRWLGRIVFIAAGTALGCLLAGLPVKAVLGSPYHYWPSFNASFHIAMVMSVFITAFTAAYTTFKARLEISEVQLKEKEVEREKALKLATEATLSSLESRLHPHFLFNTINSISSLIQEDPARAEKMLSQMAELLRFSLDSGRTSLVPLSREMKIVRDYLEIEKARFEDRLRYDIQCSSEFDDLPVPPLSLQTLVENSIKYAVSVTRQGADIRIHVGGDASHATISVEDNGPGFDSLDLPAGHGLSSLKARLESLFGSAAQLEIASQSGQTVTSLHVPWLQSGSSVNEDRLLARKL